MIAKTVQERATPPIRVSSTASSITLGLTKVSVGSYTIKWNPPTNLGMVTEVTETLTTIYGLTSNTAYSFSVQNSASEAQPSDSVTIATGLFKNNGKSIQ